MAMRTILGKEAARGEQIRQTFPVIKSELAALDQYHGGRPAIRVKMKCQHCDRLLEVWRNYQEMGAMWRGRDWDQPRSHGIITGNDPDHAKDFEALRRNHGSAKIIVYRCSNLCRPDGADRPRQPLVFTQRELGHKIDAAAAQMLEHLDLADALRNDLSRAVEHHGHFTI